MTRGILQILALAALLCSARTQVFINEVMPANDTVLADENGDFSDWIELHNTTDATVDLEGWALSDSAKTPLKWVMHKLTIPAHDFLTVFASGKDRIPGVTATSAPDQIPGLKLWTSADAINIVDPSQIRVSGNNQFIRKWIDKSGQANDLTQTTETSQPLLVANAVNGKPAVRFDGANDSLLLPAALGTNDFTMLAVFRTQVTHEIDPESNSGVGGVNGQHWLFGARHGGDYNGGSGVSVGVNGISAYEHGSYYMPALAVYHGPVVGFNVFTLSYAAKRPSLFLNSATIRTGVVSPRVQVLSTVQIGAGDYGAFNGDIAEILFYNRTLTETERAAVEGYLAVKYGIGSTRPHTNFKLSSSGESVILSKPDGTQADRLDFGEMISDTSIGRKPDGLGEFVFFQQPTPNASNLTASASEILPEVAFSMPAGFYASGFDLTLSVASPGATIRYTLDGVEPTETSTLYTAPIPIRSRAGTPNGISMIPTTPDWQPPASEVFKGAVIRARAFKNGALSAGFATRSYFVDARGRSRYSLPVVSIVTDPKNFFDANIGIYVRGNSPIGNYSERGDAWERPAHVELFETDNTRVIGKEAGVKIHGNTSQNFVTKGLDFNSNGGHGKSEVQYRIFPDRNRTSFDHFLVRPSGHDQFYTIMRDELMQSLMHDAGMEAQAARACVTFVNGEYWGLSYLKEKEDDNFISENGNVPLDQIDYLENYADAKTGDTDAWTAMIDFISTHDLSAAANYADVQTRMDVANYIDYKAAEIFNYRWDIGNHRLWRPRTPEGRFRWLQFDNDVGWGGFWAVQPAWNFDMLGADLSTDGSLYGHNTATTTFLLRNLILNPDFKIAFINRFADLLNSTLLPANTIARVNAFAATLDPEIAEHCARWRAPGSLSQWRSNVDYLRTFAQNRPATIRSQLAARFGLGSTAMVRVSVSNPALGHVQINSLDINTTWSGVYFKGLPITFHAVPERGYRLASWQGINAESFTLNSDLNVTAVFAPAILTLAIDGATVTARGPANETCTLQVSEDLETWTPVGDITFDNAGNATYSLTIAPDSVTLFLNLRL